jgi:hypothetical protein
LKANTFLMENHSAAEDPNIRLYWRSSQPKSVENVHIKVVCGTFLF